jgi:hypothetical protein
MATIWLPLCIFDRDGFWELASKNGLSTEIGYGPLGALRCTVFYKPALTCQRTFLTTQTREIGPGKGVPLKLLSTTQNWEDDLEKSLIRLFLNPWDVYPQIDFPSKWPG